MVPSFGQDRLDDYLAGTMGSPPRAQLVRAIEHHRRARPPTAVGPCAALDVGCGPGREVCELLRAGFDVLAIDAYDAMVRETESAARGLAERLGRRLEVRQGLVEHCQWSGTDTLFDLIHAGFVLPRSGLALHHGVTVANAPGLIDSRYRGELKVVLLNTDPTRPYRVHRGDRIAQLVVQRIEDTRWVPVERLDEDDRGGGFGHSGR